MIRKSGQRAEPGQEGSCGVLRTNDTSSSSKCSGLDYYAVESDRSADEETPTSAPFGPDFDTPCRTPSTLRHAVQIGPEMGLRCGLCRPDPRHVALGNLPAELTSFVGRKTDIAEVKQLLSTARLVTLIGSGGVGKTRLVLQGRARASTRVRRRRLGSRAGRHQRPGSARQLDRRGAGAVRSRHRAIRSSSCPSTSATGECCSCSTTASTFSSMRPTWSPNCCERAPHLRILATSIQPLRVEGERLYVVPPARSPGSAAAPGARHRDPVRGDGVVRRAGLSGRAGVRTRSPTTSKTSRTCARRLEGIPLAIELAAVSLRVMSVQEVAARLDERFELLTTGPRTAPDRHQTLDATLAWSFDLCLPVEQLLWARCSVFAGPFDRFAAEAGVRRRCDRSRDDARSDRGARRQVGADPGRGRRAGFASA